MLGMNVGVVFGVAVAIVDALAEGDGSATLVGDVEAAATLQPARRPAAARPTARRFKRSSRGSWWCDVAGLMACPQFSWLTALASTPKPRPVDVQAGRLVIHPRVGRED